MPLVNGWALYSTLENTFSQNFVMWNADLEQLLASAAGSPGVYYVVPVSQLVMEVVITLPGPPTAVTAS
jgi:hypothetical protein